MEPISSDLLSRYPYFAGVSEKSLEDVAAICEEKSYRSGDVLFAKGQPALHLLILVRGEVDLQSVLPSGDRKTVDTLVGGDLMCWSALIKPHRMHLDGVARTESRLLLIPADKLRPLMEEDRNLGYRLMTGIAGALGHRLEGAQIQLATRG